MKISRWSSVQTDMNLTKPLDINSALNVVGPWRNHRRSYKAKTECPVFMGLTGRLPKSSTGVEYFNTLVYLVDY
jgi:hypothetical protein